MSSISHAIFASKAPTSPPAFFFAREIDWHLNRPSAQDYKVLSKTPSEICSPALLCKVPLSRTKDHNAVCGCVLCLFVVQVGLSRWDWSETKRCGGGIGQELHYLCHEEREMELKRGLSHISSTYPPMCITSYATQNPPWKSEPPPPPLYSISFPTSQPCMRWPSRHSNIGGPLSPSRPITFRCQSAVRGASGWQKQSVTKAECEKKTKKHCGVFIISELRSPVNEARVNCCWLDVSTHGWVSPQISLRGPQRETRERMRSLTDNDVESVSSVSPLWVWLRVRQIRNADGATQRCILSAETSNCSQNLGFQVTEKDCNHGDQII